MDQDLIFRAGLYVMFSRFVLLNVVFLVCVVCLFFFVDSVH